ncbi:hypothetical protein TH1_14685 [Thalassospira lucentensis MCCC 1A00383 = DSM 14000]|nr:hypothetical protein TH1_14685 [Thalassospira lucentensis MCCC 1A00383 = DSM 14000]
MQTRLNQQYAGSQKFGAGVAIPIMAAMSAEVGQRGGAPTAAFAIFWLRRLLGHYWEKWTVPLYPKSRPIFCGINGKRTGRTGPFAFGAPA